jgi:hypothetical protein
MKHLALVLLCGSFALIGCASNTYYRGTVGLLSPSEPPQNYKQSHPRIVGRACFPPQDLLTLGATSKSRPLIEDALEDALARAPGSQALGAIDLWIRRNGCYEAEATPLVSTAGP